MDYQQTADFLEKYQLFYRDLSRQGKERFMDRLYEVKKQFKVIGRDLELSEEMSTLILSYPVQLTFGFRNFTIGKYEQIWVYPGEFQMQKSQESHAGITFSDRIIAISWKHFTQSHGQPEDGENLGMYHFAQAQIRSLRNGNSADERLASYYSDWSSILLAELQKNQEHIFYQSNPSRVRTGDADSLYPLVIEWFFEKPIELRQCLPNTYAHLCLMLNLDPTEFDNDYRFNREKFEDQKGVSQLPTRIKKKYTFYQSHWVMNLPFFGVLVLPIFYYYYILPNLLLTPLEIGAFWLALAGILYVGGKRIFVGRGLFKTEAIFLFQLIFGLTPNLMFLLHWISLFAHGPIETSTHKIADLIQYYSHSTSRGGERLTYAKSTEFLLEDHFLEDYPMARSFFREQFPETGMPENPAFEFDIARSFLGYRVIVNKRLINNHEHSGY